MKILLVSSAFYPEISPRSFRATELAREFCRMGHEVIVISKFRTFDYRDFIREFPLTYKMWRKPVLFSIPDFGNKLLSIPGKIVNRILSLLFEYPVIEETFRVKRMLKDETGYDLMVSFAVPFPVHWGVAWSRTAKHRIAGTWIADCGDPYMFARLDRFNKPFYFKFAEVNFCRKCDYITVPFDQMSNQFYPEFRSKIKVIPQGFDFKDIVLYERQDNNDFLVFIFAGSIIPGKRDLSLFLDFLSTLSFDFRFIIYSNQHEWFKSYKIALGERLILNGYIERLSLIFEMSKADFLVNVDSSFDNLKNIEAVPSKLIDYALSGRPILNINSAILDKKMVMDFLEKDYSKRRMIDLTNHAISRVAEKFLGLI